MMSASSSLLPCLWLAAASLLALASSSSVQEAGLNSYENLLMQGLYKRLAALDSGYLVDNLGGGGYPQDAYRALRDQEAAAEGYDLGDAGLLRDVADSASIRDSEYIQHSSNAGSQGFIHMSGGAGEGKQHLTPDGSIDNLKPEEGPEVKSDESLPFYCHPANPCPKGYKSTDGCQENIDDAAETHKQWIEQMQAHGYCACDHEHMFSCPEPRQDQQPSSQQLMTAAEQEDEEFKEIVNKILADRAAATYMSGEKRQTLVAKKSPRLRRSLSKENILSEMKHYQQQAKKNNPYLSGQKLGTVAKKGHA